MYIINQSCNVNVSIEQDFISWVKEELAPSIMQQNLCVDYAISRLQYPESEDDTHTVIILQWFMGSTSESLQDTLQKKERIAQELVSKYQYQILSFFTIIEPVES